ncbi:hypothetical protein ZWY2020_040609 [Hordeum vulgare]|nr:hypothetical protein ZWY2020_040609 [Hordeum vulgare]
MVDVVVQKDNPARLGLVSDDKVEVARRLVHRWTAATTIRPWHGPLPKVRLSKLTLSDFLCPSSWQVVRNKKHRRRPAAAAAPARPIAEIRSSRVKKLLGLDGPDQIVSVVGFEGAGYVAQPGAQAGHSLDLSKQASSSSIAPSPLVAFEAVSSVPRRNCPGFPAAQAGRATRVRPPPLSATAMAGRDNQQPPQKPNQAGAETGGGAGRGLQNDGQTGARGPGDFGGGGRGDFGGKGQGDFGGGGRNFQTHIDG